jgi:hypothetical protein
LLEPPEQLVVLSLGKCEVVIGQLTVFLFQFAFHFVPTPFDLQICHSNKHFARQAQISCLLQSQNDTRAWRSPRESFRKADKTNVVKQKIRYAVVGLGHIAQTAVLPAFEHAENSELAALVTGNPEKVQTGRWRSSTRRSNRPNWSVPALRIPLNQF